jgi:hypothetical protein
MAAMASRLPAMPSPIVVRLTLRSAVRVGVAGSGWE